jgi:exopolysaccharide biosynthesis predicted pyruvyltransferase EpsI
VEPQKEYGKLAMHQAANDAIEYLLQRKTACQIRIDTRLDENKTGLRSAEEIETLISRMDAVVTTRLHGTVLALKHGVPTLAIDPIAGGAKIKIQADTIGWPLVTTADAIDPAELSRTFDLCLTTEYRKLAVRCRDRARATLGGIENRIITELKHQQ